MSDVWVEITGLGDSAPTYALASDGREAAIAQARAEYLADRIDVDELEARIGIALHGLPTSALSFSPEPPLPAPDLRRR